MINALPVETVDGGTRYTNVEGAAELFAPSAATLGLAMYALGAMSLAQK